MTEHQPNDLIEQIDPIEEDLDIDDEIQRELE